MSLSAELQAIYSAEVPLDYWSGLVLSHSLGGTYYLANAASAQTGAVDGTSRVFRAIPFAFALPQRDAEGRQEMQLQICAIGGEVRTLLDAAAADPTAPIICRYGEWLYGDATQQWDPLLELALTDLVLTQDGLACVASRADTLNRSVPREVYTPDRWPGLVRR